MIDLHFMSNLVTKNILYSTTLHTLTTISVLLHFSKLDYIENTHLKHCFLWYFYYKTLTFTFNKY